MILVGLLSLAVAASFATGFVLGRSALVYRRRWKDAIALIERLSADDGERKVQWEKERLRRLTTPRKYKTPQSTYMAMEILRKAKESAR